MTKKQWKRRVGRQEAAARAGGRRRYNAERFRRMWERRFKLIELYSMQGELPRGTQQLLAQKFGVHKSQIARDLVAVREVLEKFRLGGMPYCYFRRGRVIIEREIYYRG